jgi:hypothetical protein
MYKALMNAKVEDDAKMGKIVILSNGIKFPCEVGKELGDTLIIRDADEHIWSIVQDLFFRRAPTQYITRALLVLGSAGAGKVCNTYVFHSLSFLNSILYCRLGVQCAYWLG